MPLKLTTYYRGSEIPELPGKNTFHSKELFLIYEATPGYAPVFIVATDNGKPIARLLAGIRTNKRLFPPSIVRRCEVYGTGEYLLEDTTDKEAIFGEMLEHLTTEVLRDSFMIEFRNLDNALFGYKHFRANGYFPINWLRVRNSLHSQKTAEERFSPSRIRQIKKGFRNGAKVEEAHSVEEIQEFSHMLYKIYSSHIRKHFPHIEFFRHMGGKLMAIAIREKFSLFDIKRKSLAGLHASIRETVLTCGSREVCEKHMHCNILVFWQYGWH